MSENHSIWDREARTCDLEKFKQEHPWEWRRIIWHEKLREVVYKLTRYDIG